MYTSWNGATEVASWCFYGASSEAGPFHVVGNASKDGFETTLTAKGYLAWVYSEALGAEENVLGTTPIRQTYVPNLNVTLPGRVGTNSIAVTG